MPFPRPHARWLRTAAVITAVAFPAIAVTTLDTAAQAHSHYRAADQRTDRSARPAATQDDINAVRQELNAARARTLRTNAEQAAKFAQAVKAAAAERASRDLIRQALAADTYVRPVPGPVTQWYGYHPGIDIAPPYGTPIGAAHAGVVTFVGWDDGYGMHVEIHQSDGYVTTYSHMSGFAVQVGQSVTAGQTVGFVGSTGYSTGPHLHFEVHLPDGERTDPAAWLQAHGVAL